MVDKNVPATSEVLSVEFDDLDQDTEYKVQASFDPTFPIGETLETFVRTLVDNNPPSFDLPDEIPTEVIDIAFDTDRKRWGILARIPASERPPGTLGRDRIYELDFSGNLVHTSIPRTNVGSNQWRGIVSTAMLDANGTGFWYYADQSSDDINKIPVGNPDDPTLNVITSTSGFVLPTKVSDVRFDVNPSLYKDLWVSIDETQILMAGTFGITRIRGTLSASAVRGGSPTGLDRVGETFYAVNNSGVVQWSASAAPNTASVLFSLPSQITGPRGLVVFEDGGTPSRFYTYDTALRKIVSISIDGREILTSPPLLALLRLNGRVVLGQDGPFDFTFRLFQSDTIYSPHVKFTAVATTPTAVASFSPSSSFTFPEAKRRTRAIGSAGNQVIVLPEPQTTRYYPFQVTISDPVQGRQTYDFRARLEVLRDVAIPEPPRTKTCWDGSVIPIDQDCPDEPEPEVPPVIDLWSVTPDDVTIDRDTGSSDEAIVAWSVRGATTVERRSRTGTSGAWGNWSAFDSSSDSVPIRFSTAGVRQWQLRATNAHGTTTTFPDGSVAQISLTVNAAPPPDRPPRIDGYSASPSTEIETGGFADLRFSTTNCQYVTINGDRQPSPDGTLRVTPTVTTSYELIGFHADGRQTPPQSITITVTRVTVDTDDDDDDDTGTDPEPDVPDPVSIRSFTASSLEPEENAQVTLTGTTNNATRATLKIGTAAAFAVTLNSAGSFSHIFTPTGIVRVILTAIGEGAGNTATRSLTITPQEAPPIPPGVIESFDISDRNPSSGDAVVISGRFRNATGVLTINGVDSAVASPFSRTIRPTATTTVRLTITDAAGRTAFRGGTIFVGQTEVPPASVTASLLPNTGRPGSAYTVYWDSSNATRVTRDGVDVALSGRETFTATSTARTFTFRAFGPGGDSLPVRRTFTPEVILPPFGTLVASSLDISEGQSVVLRYTSLNARSRSLTGFGSLEAANGSFTITPPAGRNIYVLTLVGNDGSIVTYSVTIVVTAVLTGILSIVPGRQIHVVIGQGGIHYPVVGALPARATTGSRVAFDLETNPWSQQLSSYSTNAVRTASTTLSTLGFTAAAGVVGASASVIGSAVTGVTIGIGQAVGSMAFGTSLGLAVSEGIGAAAAGTIGALSSAAAAAAIAAGITLPITAAAAFLVHGLQGQFIVRLAELMTALSFYDNLIRAHNLQASLGVSWSTPSVVDVPSAFAGTKELRAFGTTYRGEVGERDGNILLVIPGEQSTLSNNLINVTNAIDRLLPSAIYTSSQAARITRLL